MNNETYHKIHNLLELKSWCESDSFTPSETHHANFRWKDKLEIFLIEYNKLLSKWKQIACNTQVNTYEEFTCKFYTEWWLNKLKIYQPYSSERIYLDTYLPTFKTINVSDSDFDKYVFRVDIPSDSNISFDEEGNSIFHKIELSPIQKVLYDSYNEINNHVVGFKEEIKKLQKNLYPNTIKQLNELGYKCQARQLF